MAHEMWISLIRTYDDGDIIQVSPTERHVMCSVQQGDLRVSFSVLRY